MRPNHPQSLEKRIHTLIAKAVAASDSTELENVITELRAALKEHIGRLRKMAATRLSARAGDD